MPSYLAFTTEELRFALNLVDEFEYPDSSMVRTLILDMAIARRFAYGDDDASFLEKMRPLIKLRTARHEARAFEGASQIVH